MTQTTTPKADAICLAINELIYRMIAQITANASNADERMDLTAHASKKLRSAVREAING